MKLFNQANHMLPENQGTPLSWYYKACVPQPLAAHSVHKYNSSVALPGVWCPAALDCEYMWLINCLFHLSRGRCVSGHSHNPTTPISPSPTAWTGGNENNVWTKTEIFSQSKPIWWGFSSYFPLSLFFSRINLTQPLQCPPRPWGPLSILVPYSGCPDHTHLAVQGLQLSTGISFHKWADHWNEDITTQKLHKILGVWSELCTFCSESPWPVAPHQLEYQFPHLENGKTARPSQDFYETQLRGCLCGAWSRVGAH